MESGRFAQAKSPFNFHKSIRLTVLAHTATAHARELEVITNLDKRIDELKCKVIGDEMRLQQITRWVEFISLREICLVAPSITSPKLSLRLFRIATSPYKQSLL
jgi:hypothetical protein